MTTTLPHRHQSARWLALVACALALGWAGGCNILGPAFLLAHGPEKVKKVYELDPERTTVVFIDDPLPKMTRPLRLRMARQVERTMLEEKVVTDMVAYESAARVAAQERFDKPIAIQDVGKAVGADVIVYVLMTDYFLSSDGVTFSPIARMYVKVLDVESGRRLWPADDARGKLVQAYLPPQQGLPPSGSKADLAYQALAEAAGLRIARLFYDAQRPSRVGETLRSSR